MAGKHKPASVRGNSPLAFDDAAISAAVERHLDLGWSAATQKLIRKKVGAVNFARIEEIIAFVSNQEAWLNSASLSSAADAVTAKLNQQYPRLSPLAAFKIVNQATYGWR